MKSGFRKFLSDVSGLAPVAALAVAAPLHAQQPANRPGQHHHYKLIDLGTFGGPASYFSNGADGILIENGTSVGWADTPNPDPFPSACFDPDCYVANAFAWRRSSLTNLGALAQGWSSEPSWISGNGRISGIAQNGEIDPLTGIPETRAVVFQNGAVTDLGTFGGYESVASAINGHGLVAGTAQNTISDPIFGLQLRAFRWQDGVMYDLGTLGSGADALATALNERGQIAGISFTNDVSITDPFLWDKGRLIDLGGLGGTASDSASGPFMNDHGQVAGDSNLAGDASYHPYLWTKPGPMQDLGTLGGDNGQASWISNTGEVVGKADLPGSQTHDAFLWTNNTMTDLGTLAGDSCSNAYQINTREQVVGTSEDQTLCAVPTGEHAFLWENDGPMVDLNTLIPQSSSLELTFAFAINDRGEIVGEGAPSGCQPRDVALCGHAYVLIPCDENHLGIPGCDYSMTEGNLVATHDRRVPADTRRAVSAQRSRLSAGPWNRFRAPAG